MKKQKEQKKKKNGTGVIYYEDERNDEFSRTEIEPKRIDGKYKYIREGFFGSIVHFFLYRIVFFPIAFFYTKIALHHKTRGADLLKKYGKDGYFIYGNHTQDIGDAFMPNMLNPAKDKYFIVHPNNVSMPLLGRLTPYLGALPLPDDLEAGKHFAAALRHHIKHHRAVVVYPEAHIWPFYTGIRPFGSEAFSFPVRYGVPAFSMTSVYKKRGKDGFRIETVVDGPFYAKEGLSRKEAAEELRSRIYEKMKKRAEESDVEIIRYVKKQTPGEKEKETEND